MSVEDWLHRATRSLQDEATEVAPDETARTRARVMASLTVVERRRNRAVLLFMPIAAVLAASLALAHEGVTVRRAWGWLAGQVKGTQEPVRAEAPRTGVSAPEPGRALTPEIATVPGSAAPAIPAESATAMKAPAGRGPLPRPAIAPPAANAPARSTAFASPAADAAWSRSTSIGAPSASDETDASSLALYRKAHHLHFVDRDYAASLAAWDEYLRDVPRGPLVIEARYNRAIALVRLGHDAEARAALEPFAHGQVEGGYRQAEANALLHALDARDH